jgi:signal transduction histidine kinase/DNA-binding response OmpR family regulator
MSSASDRSSIDPAARAAAGIDASRANILIVDDRPDKLLAFRTILEDLGQDLYTATSGSDALRQVLYRDFAVILLDVNMPGIDGLETAALIRRRRKSAHTPIIFITADFNDETHQARGYALGAVDYIASPVVPEVLRAKVKVFVDLFLLAEQAKRQAHERLVLAEERAARAAAERATLRLEFLARASATLAASLDVDTTINAVLELVVPALADVGALTLTPASGERARTELAWAAHDGEPKVERRVVDEITSLVLRAAHARAASSGRAEIIVGTAAAAEDAAGAITLGPVAVDTVIVVPLLARGRTLGVMSLASAGMRRFDSDTSSVATDVASRAAVALDNALLYRDIQEDARRKSEFLAMLAHELRNPIAPIGNAVHVLNAGGLDHERVAWARGVIGRQLKQLVRLVDDLLDISRITRGAIELKIEPLDVAEVVAAAVETSRPLIDENGHTLTVSMPPERLRAVGDFARVAQALANLINNAAKYTNPGGQIWIGVSAEHGGIVFRVRDSGIGIEREFLSRIFEPFTQVDRRLDRAQGGLGIGLTLVRRLIELQHGSVTVASEGKDKGSEFVIRLPAAPAVADPKQSIVSVVDASDDALDGVRVVIVDDNRDVAESTALVLRLSNCDVQVAFDGRSGIDLVRAVRPDAVLVDIGLPGMDGFEVAKHIRAQPEHRRTLLVAVSGYGQGEHRLMSNDAGFDHHLVKPINPAALTHLLASTRPTIAPAAAVDMPASFVARRTAD